ncbi:HlyD family secretion protein, partial [Bordetella hinzii]|nr:HlyD family secretion protein [Bordetella hinzii]
MNARKFLPLAIVAVAALLGYYGWRALNDRGPGEGFVSGNGRIEATEIDVATKLAGRVEDVLVNEGAFVKAGEPLARMQIDTLNAQREEARAQHQQAINAAASARAQIALRQSDK